jgi:hypothetical protein
MITIDVTAAIEHDLFDPGQTAFSGLIITSEEDSLEFYDHTDFLTSPRLGISDTSIDGDGIPDVDDNCPATPNGPLIGTCSEGDVGKTCVSNEACGVGGFCSRNQEDTYPPQGNGIGDACDCEGNFNCAVDQDVDGSDAALFKADFGRSVMIEPCTNEAPCNGDFNCDGDADGTDAALFKQDFGRSSFKNPCPVRASGVEWCSYPLP